MQYQRELISYDNILEIPRKLGRIVSHPDIAKFLSCFFNMGIPALCKLLKKIDLLLFFLI